MTLQAGANRILNLSVQSSATLGDKCHREEEYGVFVLLYLVCSSFLLIQVSLLSDSYVK